MSRFLHCGLHWQSALITLEVVKKRVLRISDWFRPVPNFFSTTVVLFSIFSDISYYLMISLISDISTVQRFHLFYNSEGMHLSGYSTCPVLVAERRYELADSCVILPCVP